MIHKIMWGSVAVALVAVATYAVWPKPARPQPATHSKQGTSNQKGTPSLATEADGTRLRNDVSSLRGEVKDVRSQLSLVQADLNQRAPAVQEPEPHLSREEMRALEEERDGAHMAEVAAAFAREPRDTAWADTTTAFVQEKLKAAPTMVGASPVECRSSYCRFEIDRGEASFDKQLPVFFNSLGETLPRMEADYRVVDGKGRYTFFLNDPTRAAPAPTASK